MRMCFKIIVFVLFAFIQEKIYSQNTDSLKLVLTKTNEDTTRCILLNMLIESENDDNIWPTYNNELKKICEKNLKNTHAGISLHNFYLKHYAISLNNEGYLANNLGDDSTALKCFFRSLKIDEKLHNRKGMATTFNNIASLYAGRGNSSRALTYHFKSLKIHEELNDKQGIAISLNNIGLIFKHLGDIPLSLEHYHRSLKTMEELSSKDGMATSLNNIASIYKDQGETKKALEYYGKSLKIYREIKDKDGIAICLNSIGTIYMEEGKLSKALELHKESAKVFNEAARIKGYASALNSIGLIYQKLGDNKLALEYLEKAHAIYEESNSKHGTAFTLSSIAYILSDMGKLNEAVIAGEKSLKLSQELGFPETLESSSKVLAEIYAKTANWKGAFEMHKLFKRMSDSVNNEKNRKAALLKGFQYTYERKAAADSVKTAEERKVFGARMEKEKTQRMALYVIIGLIAIFTAFIFNRFRVTHKQKAIIELQKTIVEEKQKEILDSIHYAKRIQSSLLPRESYIEKALNKARGKN